MDSKVSMRQDERTGERWNQKNREIELPGRALDFCGDSTDWLAVKR
jgi:hypothetical protein